MHVDDVQRIGDRVVNDLSRDAIAVYRKADVDGLEGLPGGGPQHFGSA